MFPIQNLKGKQKRKKRKEWPQICKQTYISKLNTQIWLVNRNCKQLNTSFCLSFFQRKMKHNKEVN